MPESNPEEIALEEWIAASQSCCGGRREERRKPPAAADQPCEPSDHRVESKDAPPQP